MKQQFYTSYIHIETLYIALDGLTLTEKEKEHLKHIVETHMYHTMMDTVLSELPKSDRKMFLDRLAEEDHEKTMDFLKKRILNIEEKIQKVAKHVIQELHEDIKEIKK